MGNRDSCSDTARHRDWPLPRAEYMTPINVNVSPVTEDPESNSRPTGGTPVPPAWRGGDPR